MEHLKKPLPPWGCSKGCDVSKKMCRHLEDTLVLTQYADMGKFMEDHVVTQQVLSSEEHEERAIQVEGNLMSLGLTRLEADVLCDRFVSNFTLDDIANKRGFRTYKQVYDFIAKVVIRLKTNNSYEHVKKALGKGIYE